MTVFLFQPAKEVASGADELRHRRSL